MTANLLLFLPLLLLLLKSASAEVNCTEAQTLEVDNNFADCVKDKRKGFGGTVEEDTATVVCRLFQESVNKCGELLTKCYSGEDVRFRKDAEIMATKKFLDDNGYDHYYQDCDVIKEFIYSNRKPYRKSSVCTLDQVDNSILRYKECVARENDILQRQITDSYLTERYERGTIMCNFINKTEQECTTQLKKCMSTQELEDFLDSQYYYQAGELSALVANFDPKECRHPKYVPQNASGGPIRLSVAAVIATATTLLFVVTLKY